MLRTFVITALTFIMITSVAVAQTTAPNPNQGAFDKLSQGNQKIVQALFDAEQNNAASTTTEPLSRDDIAAMKQDGKGWGEVFKEMRTKGLIQEKNLGQVVSQESGKAGLQDRKTVPSGTLITTGSGKTFVAGTKVQPVHGRMNAGRSGNDHELSGSDSGRLNAFSGSGRDYSSGGAGAGNMSHGGRGKN